MITCTACIEIHDFFFFLNLGTAGSSEVCHSFFPYLQTNVAISA